MTVSTKDFVGLKTKTPLMVGFGNFIQHKERTLLQEQCWMATADTSKVENLEGLQWDEIERSSERVPKVLTKGT